MSFRDWDSRVGEWGGLNHLDQHHKMSREGNHVEEITWLRPEAAPWPLCSKSHLAVHSVTHSLHCTEKEILVLSVPVSDEECFSREWEHLRNSWFYSENKFFSLSLMLVDCLTDRLIGRHAGRLINCNPKVTTALWGWMLSVTITALLYLVDSTVGNLYLTWVHAVNQENKPSTCCWNCNMEQEGFVH